MRAFRVLARASNQALLVAWASLALSACAQVRETPSAEREYRAYGKTWRYSTSERYIKDWGFGSPHGIFGTREKLEQFVYLTTDGEKISVNDRIFALQRNGSYNKVECCNKALAQASVHDFDDKLIIYFRQSRPKTTDCVVYPEDQPDALNPDPEKGPYAQLFGEFDPKTNVFYVREFLPTFSREEFKSKIGATASTEQTREFFYRNRRPFICN